MLTPNRRRVSSVPRTVISLFLLLIAALPAWAEPVYFVSLAQVSKDKQPQYDAFLKAVTPIWSRHGMTSLLRVKLVDVIAEGDEFPVPTEVGILRADTGAGFQAYISDPDFQSIKADRLDAVDHFVVLEGVAGVFDGPQFMDRVPMAAISLIRQETTTMGSANLEFKISLAGRVKGEPGPLLNAVKIVQIHALSFDDNPMNYVRRRADASFAPVLIGEILRP